jgi:hypothetical protein
LNNNKINHLEYIASKKNNLLKTNDRIIKGQGTGKNKANAKAKTFKKSLRKS